MSHTITLLDGYIIEEFTELDFEHITLSSALDALHVVHCHSCGTEHTVPQAGIWACDICNTVNHCDL